MVSFKNNVGNCHCGYCDDGCERCNTSKLNKDSSIIDIRRAVAKVVKMPCPISHTTSTVEPSNPSPKCYCEGTNWVFPLRVTCPCTYNDWDRHECGQCYRAGVHMDEACKRCTGTNWVPITCPDVYMQAIQDMGGRYELVSDNLGDLVLIHIPEYNEGYTNERDGLHSSNAILVAFGRALDVVY